MGLRDDNDRRENVIVFVYSKRLIIYTSGQKYKMLFSQYFLAGIGEIQLSMEIYFSEYWMMRLNGDWS